MLGRVGERVGVRDVGAHAAEQLAVPLALDLRAGEDHQHLESLAGHPEPRGSKRLEGAADRLLLSRGALRLRQRDWWGVPGEIERVRKHRLRAELDQRLLDVGPGDPLLGPEPRELRRDHLGVGALGEGVEHARGRLIRRGPDRIADRSVALCRRLGEDLADLAEVAARLLPEPLEPRLELLRGPAELADRLERLAAQRAPEHLELDAGGGGRPAFEERLGPGALAAAQVAVEVDVQARVPLALVLVVEAREPGRPRRPAPPLEDVEGRPPGSGVGQGRVQVRDVHLQAPLFDLPALGIDGALIGGGHCLLVDRAVEQAEQSPALVRRKVDIVAPAGGDAGDQVAQRPVVPLAPDRLDGLALRRREPLERSRGLLDVDGDEALVEVAPRSRVVMDRLLEAIDDELHLDLVAAEPLDDRPRDQVDDGRVADLPLEVEELQ